MYTSLPRGVARCQHIKVNGTRCDSPALKGKAYCYFHYRSRLRDAAPAPTANDQRPPAALPNDQRLTPNHSSRPHPLSPPPDLFLLEDANSIQCALQWVLRRILDASMDHRQASLLLYGLQIAAANIKLTRFKPSYDDIIRTLPADPQPSSTVADSPLLATTPPELATDHCPLATDPPPSSSPPTDPQPSTTAEGREPTTDSSRLPTDPCPPATASNHCPLTTNAVAPPRNKRPSRRLRTSSLATDNWQLATVKPALSQMFQREVRRHLARLNFPASPDSDPEI